VAHPELRRRYRLDEERFLFVYVDLQIVDEGTTPARLWQHLLQRMARHCQHDDLKRILVEDLHDAGAIDNFALEDLFDTLETTPVNTWSSYSMNSRTLHRIRTLAQTSSTGCAASPHTTTSRSSRPVNAN
jgi:hypothetical protein